MIKMHVMTDEVRKDHFAVYADEPMRIEVVHFKNENQIIAHIYLGVEDNQDDDPIGGYDSEVKNESWQYPPPKNVNLSDVLADLRRTIDQDHEDPASKIQMAELAIRKKYPHFDVKIVEVLRNRQRHLRLQFKRTSIGYAVPLDLSSLRGDNKISEVFDEIEELSESGCVEVIKSRFS